MQTVKRLLTPPNAARLAVAVILIVGAARLVIRLRATSRSYIAFTW